jgi:hypothetical protein
MRRIKVTEENRCRKKERISHFSEFVGNIFINSKSSYFPAEVD